MNIIKFVKILVKHFKFIVIIPLIASAVTYFLTKDTPNTYQTETTLFTGITSNSGLELATVRIDNNATKNAYDNVMTIFKSDQLFEEVSIHLLVQHLMLTKPDKEIISEKAFEKLKEDVPAEVKKLIVKGNFENSYLNIKKYIKADKKNFIYGLLNYSNPYYSFNAISRLKVERISNSDLIRISYESSDPAIAYNTVKFATEIFIEKYSMIKVGQSNSAVAYYEKKLAEMTQKLKEAEDKLLEFNVTNDIINYNEQTEQVTTQQEKIEIKLQEAKMECDASIAVLNKIENEVESRFKINLKNKEVFMIRNQLVDYNLKIANAEIDESFNKATLSEFKTQKHILEKTLENKIDSITIFDTKGQGMEAQRILSEWLDAVKSVESNNALFKSMKERLIEFMKQFKRYAPLGATIKRIEREIDINEREYLYILGQLGIARQKQQNTDMISDMKIMDEPKIPLNPLPSKKKLYIIISAVFSAILYILAIFIIQLLDSRIKTPSQLNKLSNFEVLAAFCNSTNKKAIGIENITDKAAHFIYEKIKMSNFDKKNLFLTDNVKFPYVIQIICNWDKLITKSVAEIIFKEFSKNEHSIKILDFSNKTQEDSNIDENTQNNENNSENEIVTHKLHNNQKDYLNLSELVNKEEINEEYIILIQNPLTDGIENTQIFKSADINLLVFDANSTWSDADNYYLNKINQNLTNEKYVILTNAIPDDIEEMYGEIPKKRSILRVLIKKSLRNIS
jgi:uncharacterized protein involved in exopolysaccharide biosynthesis